MKEKSVFEKIQAILTKNNCYHKVLEHQAVFTSQEAADVRGTKLSQGAKALVMYADKHPVLLVLSAAKKAKLGEFKKGFGVRDLRMATKEEVKELTGLEVGAIPPFGSLMGLPTWINH